MLFYKWYPKKVLKEDNFKLNVNDNFSLEKLNACLYDIGYEKVSIVLEPYEYAVRGGIIRYMADRKSILCRIDFFGNKVESIKSFNPVSQISIKSLE